MELMCDCNVIHQEAVDMAISKLPKDDIFNDLVNTYKILSDSTRCKLLFAIDQHEMCVCDLANVVNMSKSSVSHQLAVLREARLVKSRRDGKEIYYTLDDEHVSKMFDIALEHVVHKKEEEK